MMKHREIMKNFYLVFCIVVLIGINAEAQIIVVQPGGKEPVLKIGGLLQVQADAGDRGDSRFTTGDDRFYLRRARLNATGNFLEDFDFKLEMDLFGSLSNSPTSISSNNVRAQLTDGYINWNKLEYANVKGGQFKTPFGFEQLYSDPKMFTIERSLVNDRLTVGRQLGAQINGDAFEKRISYATGLFNGNNVNNTFNDNDKFLYAGRFSGTIWDGHLHSWDTKFSAGINGFASEDRNLTGQSSDFPFTDLTFTGKRRGLGVDAQFQTGPLEVWFEYLRDRFEPEDQLPLARFDADGWYLQGVWSIQTKIQAVLKYETFRPVIDADLSTDIWTLGFNYLFKGDDLKFMVNYLNTDAIGIPDTQHKLLVRMQAIF
jgi:phosphate-selective porin OprO and OprP